MELKLPDARGTALNVTVPWGKAPVPDPVSETVAVQVEPWPMATDEGAHVTVVDVGLMAAVSVKFLVKGDPVHVPLFAQVTTALEPESGT